MRASTALFAKYCAAPEPSTLEVWADALLEEGDPRGEYFQLCQLPNPSDAQLAKRRTLEKKLLDQLLGPARASLREWKFGGNGLVERARCEADKLVGGVEAIAALNPRLALAVTSVKKVTVLKELAKLPLGRIHYVDFSGRVLGTSGPSQLSERHFRILVPALRAVRNLGLSCIGNDVPSPEALRALGDAHVGLEFLSLTHDRSSSELDEYVDAIVSSPGFKSLRGLHLPLANGERLRHALPHLVGLEVWEADDVFPDPPLTGPELETFKTRGTRDEQ